MLIQQPALQVCLFVFKKHSPIEW